ncbi:O-antigen ligase family protein [bacterium]|nr:O-antigen ligase family protein [bacterium]
MIAKFGNIRIASFKLLSVSESLLLLYLISVILISMTPGGNLVSKLVGLILLYFFVLSVIKSKRKILISREIYFAIGWLVIGLISGFVATDINLVYVKVFTIIQLLIFFIVGYSIINQSAISIKTIFYVFIISVVIAFLYGLLTQGNSAVVVTRNRIVGTAGDPNQIAVFGAFAILFSIYLIIIEKKYIFKLLNIAFIAILVLGIVKTQSRQGILIILVSTIVLLILNYFSEYKRSNNKSRIIIRSLLILLFSIVIIGIVIYYFRQSDYYYRVQALITFVKISLGSTSDNITKMIDYSAYERKKLISFGIRMWLDHPIIGIGLDNFRVVIKNYWPISNRLYSHNNYIELLSTIGTAGTIVYYSIYYSIFKKLSQVNKKSEFFKNNHNIKLIHIFITAMVCLMVLEFVTVTYYSKFTWILLMIILGYTDKLSNAKQVEE